jgi:hypothetical protein
VPSLTTVTGTVSVVPDSTFFMLRNVGQYFTLTLEDGRRLDVFLKDSSGAIAVAGGQGFH